MSFWEIFALGMLCGFPVAWFLEWKGWFSRAGTPKTPHANDGPKFDEDGQPICPNPAGHEWAYTGTAYGGDDTRWCGEGRCYCIHCGADGDA